MRWYSRLACNIQSYSDRIYQAGMLLLALTPFVLSGAYYYYTDYRYTVLRDIKKRGELTIVTRNAPTTYFEGPNEQYAGLEHDLGVAFADYLGVKPRFILEDNISSILDALNSKKAEIAAAGLTVTDLRSEKYLFGPSYQEVKQQVVCRRNTGVPHSIDDLLDKEIVVPEGTSYIESLERLRIKHPGLQWKVDPDSDTEVLLWKVWKREIDCTISDSNIIEINQRYYPELYPTINISEEDPLAWALPKDAVLLQDELDDWMSGFEDSGRLKDLLERYYGHLEEFDYVDTRRYRNKIHTTLPKYRAWFKRAAKKYEMDWMLLAAVSYQESHWNPRAKSSTGVRGMMMLTLTTAAQLGVDSRLDAKSNIYAGAKYLSQLRDRLPESIKEPERTWMALVAYNMGYGHLEDARVLTERLGKDPNRWVDVESVLPLISQKKYYKTLKHGYARGYEAVQYVSRVRDYRDILQKYMSG